MFSPVYAFIGRFDVVYDEGRGGGADVEVPSALEGPLVRQLGVGQVGAAAVVAAGEVEGVRWGTSGEVIGNGAGWCGGCSSCGRGGRG